MDDERNPGDVFAIPDLWGPPKSLDGPIQSSFIFSQLKLDDIDKKLPEIVEQSQYDDIFFSIPELTLGPPEALIPTPSGSDELSTEAPCINAPEEGEEEEAEDDFDIWIIQEEEPPISAEYRSWDAFTIEGFCEPETPYLTEAGAQVFDTALAADEDFLQIGNADHVVVDSKVLASSVLALGLGRNSIFFTWDQEKRSFVPTVHKFRISGHTTQSLNGFLEPFYECGNVFRFLQDFVDRTYSFNKSPGRVALAESISTVLTAIQSRLNTSISKYESILQLQALFRPAHSVLICFKRIVSKISPKRNDEAILSALFEEIQLHEHRTDYLRSILLEILSRASDPWLEFASAWLGLQREIGLPLTKDGPGKSFVKIDNKEWVDEAGLELSEPDFALDHDRVPSFIPLEDAQAMFEVGRSLRFLRAHHMDHPLSRMEVVEASSPPALQWKYSWQDILTIESKALKYEEDLAAAIRSFSQPESPVPTLQNLPSTEREVFKLDFFGKAEEEMRNHVLASIDMFNSNLQEPSLSTNLAKLLNSCLSSDGTHPQDDDSIFSPPISLAPMLSFNPIISAQARVVNSTCMRLFFKSHKLRDHLLLQKDFHLFGNGVFSSRLSHALFDPELESAERQRGVARTGGVMGLRLGGRDTWPPASSELRLALMGVLTESYASNQRLDHSRVKSYLDRQGSLPGDLSFAVRDMSEEEIEKCMDPNSIEALDFLRLSYKPPAPLEAILTPIVLYKYDQLFKLLLRTLRMLYVVSALFRDATDRTSYWQDIDPSAHKFRIESRHFISSVCGYFFDTGIESTWRIFERKLDEIDQYLSNDNASLGEKEGLDKLREYHEHVLNRMMFSLLLRKRQKPVMKLLEEIFTLVLQFSKHSRERALGVEKKAGQDNVVRDMYAKFKKKVGVFITVCSGLSEKKGYGEKGTDGRMGSGGLFDGSDLVEESTIGQLVLRLEMSGYYLKGTGL